MCGIAANMDVHQSTASSLIKTLVRKELIAMEKSEENRRIVELRIFPTGEHAVGQGGRSV